MSIISFQNPWVFIVGILGNIVSIMVYLSPLPTFYRIFKRKSTEGFHSLPYVVALFSAMLWIYYATIRSNMLLITINSFGCIIESIYVAIFVAYAAKKARVLTLKLLILLNFAGFGLIIVFTQLLTKGSKRTIVLGWICVALSALVYIAPLSILRQVIRTKNVEFLPIGLSFSLLFNAVTWFFYGLLSKDLFVALPNIIGFIFGVLQILLYFIYKKSKEEDKNEQTLPTTNKASTINTCDIHPVFSLPVPDDAHELKNQNMQDLEEPAAADLRRADDTCIPV